MAAQNFPAIDNVRNIEEWNKFWNDLQKQDKLNILEENLERYNKIPNIQPTNCLAYVQRMINIENGKISSMEIRPNLNQWAIVAFEY